jgi:hypothetical protein
MVRGPSDAVHRDGPWRARHTGFPQFPKQRLRASATSNASARPVMALEPGQAQSSNAIHVRPGTGDQDVNARKAQA